MPLRDTAISLASKLMSPERFCSSKEWDTSNFPHLLDLWCDQGLTGSRYPTRPDLFFNYPTRPEF